ncbi:MAG TPA: hypothetical protein VGG74_07690 [Kofleriaceae bacterium]
MRWACALMLSGCSYLGMHGPMTGRPDPNVDCSRARPSAEAFVAVLAGGIAATAYDFARAHGTLGDAIDDAILRRAIADPALVVAAVTGALAAYGFYDVHACRSQIDSVVTSMQLEARQAARSGRCDELDEIRGRLVPLGRDLDLREPEIQGCFAYYCARSDAGFCACSHERSECQAAVKSGLAPACVPAHVDVCTAVTAARSI